MPRGKKKANTQTPRQRKRARAESQQEGAAAAKRGRPGTARGGRFAGGKRKRHSSPAPPSAAAASAGVPAVAPEAPFISAFAGTAEADALPTNVLVAAVGEHVLVGFNAEQLLSIAGTARLACWRGRVRCGGYVLPRAAADWTEIDCPAWAGLLPLEAAGAWSGAEPAPPGDVLPQDAAAAAANRMAERVSNVLIIWPAQAAVDDGDAAMPTEGGADHADGAAFRDMQL